MNVALSLVRWPVALWRGVARGNVLAVLALCAVFVSLLSMAVLFAHDPTGGSFGQSSFNGAGGLPGAVKAVPLVGAGSLAPDDPVIRFAQTRMGQVIFSKTQSDNCGRYLFDNSTGSSYEVQGVFCGQTPDKVTGAETPDRLMALRKSFQK